MNSVNKVYLTGQLENQPEIRTFQNGNKVARFSLSTREEFTDPQGQQRSNTQWHFITAWGSLAERVGEELEKGSKVSIEGRLVTKNYTDRKSGLRKYVTQVEANVFEIR